MSHFRTDAPMNTTKSRLDLAYERAEEERKRQSKAGPPPGAHVRQDRAPERDQDEAGAPPGAHVRVDFQ